MSEDASVRPSRRRWLIGAAGLGAIGALAAGVYLGSMRGVGPTLGTDSLFAVSLPDANGQEQRLGQWRGKVLVVNFWATWCAPCREEMPQFMKEQAALGGRGLQFVGIAVDEPAKVRAYVDELGLNYPALVGGFGAIDLSKAFGNKVMALPFTIIIDRDGKIVHTQLGPLSPAKLQSVIAKLL